MMKTTIAEQSNTSNLTPDLAADAAFAAICIIEAEDCVENAIQTLAMAGQHGGYGLLACKAAHDANERAGGPAVVHALVEYFAPLALDFKKDSDVKGWFRTMEDLLDGSLKPNDTTEMRQRADAYWEKDDEHASWLLKILRELGAATIAVHVPKEFEKRLGNSLVWATDRLINDHEQGRELAQGLVDWLNAVQEPYQAAENDNAKAKPTKRKRAPRAA